MQMLENKNDKIITCEAPQRIWPLQLPLAYRPAPSRRRTWPG